MCACMYIRVHVCACVYIWMHVSTYVRTEACLYSFICLFIYGCMCVCMCAQVWVYVSDYLNIALQHRPLDSAEALLTSRPKEMQLSLKMFLLSSLQVIYRLLLFVFAPRVPSSAVHSLLGVYSSPNWPTPIAKPLDNQSTQPRLADSSGDKRI